jgi:phosphatidylinositol glycan class B
LRTALHPWIFAVVYKITDAISTLEGATRTVRAQDLLVAPKIVQGMFAAAMDFYTWKLGRKVYGADSDAAMVTVRVLHSIIDKRRLTNIPDSLR